MSKFVSMNRLDAYIEALKEFDLAPKDQLGFFRRMISILTPDKIVIPEEVLSEIYSKVDEYLKNISPNTTITFPQIAKAVGVDPTNKPVAYRMRNYIKDLDLLQHRPATEEVWVKRLTHETTGSAD